MKLWSAIKDSFYLIKHDRQNISDWENRAWYFVLGFMYVFGGLVRILTFGNVGFDGGLRMICKKMSREAESRNGG